MDSHGLILLGSFIIFLLAGIHSTFVSCSCIKDMENQLEGCRIIHNLQGYDTLGLFGKELKCSILGFVLMFPNAFARKGMVEMEVIANFPMAHKLRLWVPLFFQVLAFIVMITLRP